MSNGQIVSYTEEGMVHLWDASGVLLVTLQGHRRVVTDAAFSPLGRILYTGSMDGSVRRWDLTENQIPFLRGHTKGVYALSFSSDGEFVVTSSGDGTVRLWDKEGNFRVKVKEYEKGKVSNFNTFSPDGQYLLISANHGIEIFSGDILKMDHPIAQIESDWDLYHSPEFSPDSEHLIVPYSTPNDSKGLAVVWSPTGEKVLELLHESLVTVARFSPDGKFIITAANDNIIRLFDRKGQLLKTFRGHDLNIRNIRFSSDNRFFLSASSDGTARLWDFENEVAVFGGHTAGCSNALFTPDNQFILTISGDNRLQYWDLQGQLIRELEPHGSPVTAISFSPDGKFMLTASQDKTCRLWTSSGEVLTSFSGFYLQNEFWGISDACFSPNGHFIATCSISEGARIWPFDPQIILEKIKTLSIDELPERDKKKFGID